MSFSDFEHRRAGALLVTGAPGSGRTRAATEFAVRRVEGGIPADEVLVISASRVGAARMRQDLAARLSRTASQPLARSGAATAFAIVRAWAVANSQPPPVLVSGPEQDAVLAELIEGHLAGEGAAPQWPDTLPVESLRLTGFRAELRDLLMRAAEYGLSPEELVELGRANDYQPWIAGGMVYGEYLNVTAQRWSTPDSGQRFDAAGIMDSAANLLELWHREYSENPHGELPAPPHWRVVIVDDYQEATAAMVRLLHVLQGAGSELLLFGDPDVAVQTFRGAQPALMARAELERADLERGGQLGAFGASHAVLDRVHGQLPGVRAVTEVMTQMVGSVGLVGHRAAPSSETEGGQVEVVLAKSPAREIAHLAYELRRARVVDGLEWGQMAVIARSGAAADELRRGLIEHEVPVLDKNAEILLRSEAAVQPLLGALEYAVTGEIDTERLTALLRSPLAGLDSVKLRRLRRSIWLLLKSEEQAVSVDEALTEVVLAPLTISLPATIRRPVERIGAMLRAARDAAGDPLASAESVLWAAWHATGLARQWQDQAIAGGAGGREADRNLDAVLSLFAAAARYVERMPGARIRAFVDQINSENLPADSLAARASGQEGVAVLTPAGAAGDRWEFVCVAGVQAEVWPDVRLRDTVLGAQRLTEVLTGRAQGLERDYAAARRAVLHDEARSFVAAISRARSRLIVSAVDDAENDLLPSPFVQALIAADVEVVEAAGMGDPSRVPVSLRELVAVLRRAAGEEQPDADDSGRARREAAEKLLAGLAQHAVPGADPADWNGIAEITTTEALITDDEPIFVSPSRLDSFLTCPLRWALEQAGGTLSASIQQNVGNLVHELAAELPSGTREELLALLDEKWPTLGLPDGWVGIVKRAEVEQSVDRLANYLAQHPAYVSVEEPFMFELGRARVRGTADRIERNESGDVRVVDFKTGTYASAEDIPRNSQLGAYQLAVSKGCFGSEQTSSGGAALVYVGGPNKGFKELAQVALSEDEEPEWVEKRIGEVTEQMSASVFTARRNAACPRCPVRRSCPIQNEGERVI